MEGEGSRIGQKDCNWGSAQASADCWGCSEADLAPQTGVKFEQGTILLCPMLTSYHGGYLWGEGEKSLSEAAFFREKGAISGEADSGRSSASKTPSS